MEAESITRLYRFQLNFQFYFLGTTISLHWWFINAHERAQHSWLNHTLTHVRQHYWIPQARQFIKKLLRHCVTCRKVNGKRYKAPDPPPLPTIRLVDSHPFTVTGVDFAGALYVKTPTAQEKVYMCLFTSANTRAVHLTWVSGFIFLVFRYKGRWRRAARKIKPDTIVDLAVCRPLSNYRKCLLAHLKI